MIDYGTDHFTSLDIAQSLTYEGGYFTVQLFFHLGIAWLLFL
jgi:hypothetical protein